MLEHVHRRALRKLTPTLEGPRGVFLLALGKSPNIRREVSLELQQIHPKKPVREVVFSTSPLPPWDLLREAGKDDAIVVACGLGTTLEQQTATLRSLNFGRAIGPRERLRIILWLDDDEQYKLFIERAPDLWAYRSGVEWFPSLEDLKISTRAEDKFLFNLSQNRLNTIEKNLTYSFIEPDQKISLLLKKSRIVRVQGQLKKAIECVEEAEKILISEKDPEEILQAEVFLAKIGILAKTQGATAVENAIKEISPRGALLKYILLQQQFKVATVLERADETISTWEKLENVRQKFPIHERLTGDFFDERIFKASFFIRRGVINLAKDEIRKISEDLAIKSKAEQNIRIKEFQDLKNIKESEIFISTGNYFEGVRANISAIDSTMENERYSQKFMALRALEKATSVLGIQEFQNYLISEMRSNFSYLKGQEAASYANLAESLLEKDPEKSAIFFRLAKKAYQQNIDMESIHSERIRLRIEWAWVIWRLHIFDKNNQKKFYSTALKWLQRAANDSETEGFSELLINALSNMEIIHLNTNQPQKAQELSLKKVQVLQTHGWGRAPVAGGMVDIARAQRAAGDLGKAAETLRQAETLALKDGPDYYSRTVRRRCLEELAEVRLAQDDRGAALAVLEETKEMLQKAGLRPASIEVELNLSPLLPADERLIRLIGALGAAMEMKLPGLERDAYVNLAECNEQLGKLNEAQGALEEVLDIASFMGKGPLKDRISGLQERLKLSKQRF